VARGPSEASTLQDGPARRVAEGLRSLRSAMARIPPDADAAATAWAEGTITCMRKLLEQHTVKVFSATTMRSSAYGPQMSNFVMH
jgi:hypothetical protein